MKEPTVWRVAWKGKDGKKHFGSWRTNKGMVMAWAEQSNKDFPKFLHWCEPRRDGSG